MSVVPACGPSSRDCIISVSKEVRGRSNSPLNHLSRSTPVYGGRARSRLPPARGLHQLITVLADALNHALRKFDPRIHGGDGSVVLVVLVVYVGKAGYLFHRL